MSRASPFRWWVPVTAIGAVFLASVLSWVVGRWRAGRLDSVAVGPLESSEEGLGAGVAAQLADRLSAAGGLRVVGVYSTRRAMAAAGDGVGQLGVASLMGGRVELENGRIRATLRLTGVRSQEVIWQKVIDQPLGQWPSGLEEVVPDLVRQFAEGKLRAGKAPGAWFPRSEAGWRDYWAGLALAVGEPRRAYAHLERAGRESAAARARQALVAAALRHEGIPVEGPAPGGAEQSADSLVAEAAQALAGGEGGERAEGLLRRALELQPGSAEARHWYGHWHEAGGRAAEAVDSFYQALTGEPYSAIYAIDLGFAYLADKRVETAREHFERARTLFPHEPLAWVGVGLAWRAERKWDEARREFRAQAVKEETRAPALAAWAEMESAAGHRDEALRIKREFEAAPASSEAPADLVARMYEGVGEPDKAAACLRAARERGEVSPLRVRPARPSGR